MITEVIRYSIASGRESEFEAAYRQAQEILAASPHCLGCEMVRSVKEASRFVLLIRWVSAEGHLEGFRKSPDFGRFFALVRPFFEMIEEMEHYGQTSVGFEKPGGER